MNAPDGKSLQEQNAALKEQLKTLQLERDDLEMALNIAVEHGDTIESELVTANGQLQKEISQREETQRRLQALIEAIHQQKDDLEIIVGTLVEHGDSVDQHMWESLLNSEKRGATDPLTGLANRRNFDTHLFDQIRSCARHDKPLTLLMCDIDFFKQFNDTYGHPAGDECLRKVAAVIGAKAKRASDLAVRYGGEEFAIVMGECDANSAKNIADAIVSEVRALGVAHKTSQAADVVTISVGYLTLCPSPTEDSTALVTKADHFLYRAKQLGRDQAFTEPPVPKAQGEQL